VPRPVDGSPPLSAPAPNEERLDSWKEIAAFLHRDVRTVQRWEKQAGLPVHRHAESRLRTAYAYRSELEAWWRTQRTTEEEQEESIERRSQVSARPIIAGTLALLLVAAAGAAFFLTRTKAREAAVPAPEKITVLLTSVEAKPDDPTIAPMVADAISRKLSGHGTLETAAPARITRMLRLMRRDPAAPLTIPTARELAVRDGGIRFVVTAAVQRSQSGFLVNLHAVDPLDGRVRVSVERQAAGRHALAAQAAEAATQLSHDLGDVGIPPAAIEPLEPVTTPSLSALRLYTSAVQAGRRRQWGASELLARQAVGADPEFASAYSWIGWAMRRKGGRFQSVCRCWIEQSYSRRQQRNARSISSAERVISSPATSHRPLPHTKRFSGCSPRIDKRLIVWSRPTRGRVA
jgi:hypothetical protein